MAQETFSNLQPIKGETFSSVTPIGSTPAQPGFFTRLGQSLGLPTSQADVDNLAPTSIKDALMQAAKASTGFLPALVNYGRTAAKGFSEGTQDIDEAATNIGQGGPVLSNIGKAVSGAIHASLQATPVVGPSIDTAGQDVSQGNLAGAAGGLTGVIGQLAAPKILEGASDLAGKTVDAAKEAFVEPKATPPLPELPKPVSSPVSVDSPFDDATIRKSVGGKDLSPDARETLRNAAGPVVQAGSSPELHLLKAVPEINSTITTQGNALDSILKNAPPLSEAPKSAVTDALNSLKEELPGGSEEQLGKAIDKEALRYSGALDSTNPLEINQTIRDLDSRISSYTAPEEPLEGPASAKDAALVTIRRTLRDALNENYPETTPINKQLSDAIEVRKVLQKRLGNVANDSSAANSQYQSELLKGQNQLAQDTANQSIADENAARKAGVQRNRNILKTVGAVAGGAGLLQTGKAVVSNLVK